MPYLSDEQLSSIVPSKKEQTAIVQQAAASAFPVIGSMGVAGIVGYLRAKFEDPSTGQWNVPGTKYDAEGAAFLVLGAVALFGQHAGLGEYRSLAAIGAIGVGSHYAGEMGRHFAKTGQVSFRVGSGVPPWDPNSFDPTQLGDPHADPAAQGLSSSGV